MLRFSILQLLDRNTSGHLSVIDFQGLFDARGPVTQSRPPMSFVQNRFLRQVQIIVAHKCFDYFGDFVAFVNVLLMSVSTARFCASPLCFSLFEPSLFLVRLSFPSPNTEAVRA